jgi:hypothetical protein
MAAPLEATPPPLLCTRVHHLPVHASSGLVPATPHRSTVAPVPHALPQLLLPRGTSQTDPPPPFSFSTVVSIKMAGHHGTLPPFFLFSSLSTPREHLPFPLSLSSALVAEPPPLLTAFQATDPTDPLPR